MTEKIKDFQNKFKNAENRDLLIAALAYIPLFGWIYPSLFKKEDDFCQFHVRQSMQLNGIILAVYFAVWILENFPIVSWIFGPDMLFFHLSRSVWILSAIAFIAVSIHASLKALEGERWAVPFMNEYLKKFYSMIRGE